MIFFFKQLPTSGIFGLSAVIFNIIRNWQTDKLAYHFASSTTMSENPRCSVFSTILGIVNPFNFCHSNGYAMVSYWSFSFHFLISKAIKYIVLGLLSVCMFVKRLLSYWVFRVLFVVRRQVHYQVCFASILQSFACLFIYSKGFHLF